MKAAKPGMSKERAVGPAIGGPWTFRRVCVALAAALLVALTVLVYVPAIRGGFIWDDDCYVTDNVQLDDAAGLWRIWREPGATVQYYPLTFTTFWLECRLWGFRPTGYHLINVLLHGLNAVLLWFVLRRLAVPGAWLAAALFAVHPVHVESVAWITERKNVLSGAFYLAAALSYLRFLRLDGSGCAHSTEAGPQDAGIQAGPCHRWRWYAAAVLLFLCALFSKTVTGSLPAAVLLVLWWRRGRIRRTDVYPLVPFFALALSMGLLTVLMEKHHVGALGSEWNLSPLDRCLIAGRALWFYAGKLAWPAHLTFIYPRWHINAGLWWQYLYPLAALAVVAAMWLARHRIGRGPLAAVLFFGGTLVPALGFINVFPMRFSFVADHFQYLASLGLIVLAVAAGVEPWRRLGTLGRTIAPVLASCVLVLLCVLTWRQGHVYADAETLYRDTLRKNPGAWLAHSNLASILVEKGRLEEAGDLCHEALRLEPDYPEALVNLGNVLRGKERLEEAADVFRKAVKLKPDDPAAHNNLGNTLVDLGQRDEGIRHLKRAIELVPGFALAYNNLGQALARQGQLDEAITHFRQAARLSPGLLLAHRNLGFALFHKGRYPEAIEECRFCLGQQPNDFMVLEALADAYAATDRRSEAMDALRLGIRAARTAGQTDFESRFQKRLEELSSGRGRSDSGSAQ